jgi:hypothetical protein
MKKKKVCIGKWKISIDSLHWVGFSIAAIGITLLTAYGFSMSLRPNSFTLDSAPEAPLAMVGVALANNIGTGIPRANEIPVNLPADVPLVQQAIVQGGISGVGFFEEHFPRISELTEILNIDVVAYLRIHPDKQNALENYINQLEEKKNESEEAMNALKQLNALHANTLPGIQSEIKNKQASIESSYNNRDGGSIMNQLADLEELHIQEQEHKNVVVFTSRIAAEYNTLITAANQKLTVLRANMAPLIQGVTVKLPQGININALKDLKIFATETN